MPKVLFVVGNWVWGGGGLQKTVKMLIENLPARWEREVLSLHPSPVIMRIGRRKDLPVPKNVKMHMIEKNAIVSRFLSLIRFLKESKPDIISAHISPAGDFPLLILARKIAHTSAPLILWNHGFRQFPRRYRPFAPLVKYMLRKNVNTIVAISQGLEKFIEKVWRVPREKLMTIYPPRVGEEMLRAAEEVPKEYKLFPPQNIKIVAVARLSPREKDFQTLLRAFALLRKKYKKANLFLVGGGGEKDVAQIMQWIEGLSLRDSVFLVGHRANPYPYIKYADISVLSSVSEGLGTVIVESMALGCPVIATDCPFGPRELIGNNENGIIVPMKDYIKMAEGMMKILEDEELRNKIIENAKKKAEEFRISTSVQKFEGLLNKLLKETRRNGDVI